MKHWLLIEQQDYEGNCGRLQNCLQLNELSQQVLNVEKRPLLERCRLRLDLNNADSIREKLGFPDGHTEVRASLQLTTGNPVHR